MIALTKSANQITPTVFQNAEVVPSLQTFSEIVTGDYTYYRLMSGTTPLRQVTISGEFDSLENVTPDKLDFSEYPLIKAVDVETELQQYGIIRARLNGVSKYYPVIVGYNGIPSVSNVVVYDSIIPNGNRLHHSYTAATGINPDNSDQLVFRLKSTGQPVQLGPEIMPHPSLYQRNTNCWAYGLDLTGTPIATGLYTPRRAGALITTRHLAMARHTALSYGSKVFFMTMDNQIVERHVIGSSYSRASYAGREWAGLNFDYQIDHLVHVLNEPVDSNIKVYPVCGSWVRDGFEPSGQTFQQTDVGNSKNPYVWITLNRKKQVGLMGNLVLDCRVSDRRLWSGASLHGVDLSGEFTYLGYAPMHNIIPNRRMLPENGDSGSPLFALLSDNSLALACTMAGLAGGSSFSEALGNAYIADADADAIARGNLASPTGLTVTVAPDPTL